MDIAAAKKRCEGVTVPVQWTEEERSEWMRGSPYSPKFTQGVVHQLSAALEALEEAQGKLDAVRAWRHGLATQLRDGGGAILDWNTLDHILSGLKEEATLEKGA